MSKIYYALGGQKFEVAKVTLENYKEVGEWILSHSLTANIHRTSDGSGLTVKVTQQNLIGDKEKSINIRDQEVCFITRNLGSGSLDLCSSEIFEQSSFRPEHHLMQLFQYKHLPEHLQAISKPICELAERLDSILPNNPEKTTALRKLREAKDCAVTATIFK